jgi:2-polyprenyl-3-methyl-5-hydroxy-6-metoxy-1,4-benzoquinol methylase
MKRCCCGLEQMFGEKEAGRDLRRFRRRGPLRSTRKLVDAIRVEGVKGATVMDIGGGVGAVQHLLLEAGAATTLDVDVSRPYTEAAANEGERRGNRERMDFRIGDFVELAPALQPADVVTLDRVICCYPDMERLVDESAARAGRLYGVVYPRSSAPFRLARSVGNLFMRLRRMDFRLYIHETERVDRKIREHGFELAHRSSTLVWQIFVYRRVAGGGGPTAVA